MRYRSPAASRFRRRFPLRSITIDDPSRTAHPITSPSSHRRENSNPGVVLISQRNTPAAKTVRASPLSRERLNPAQVPRTMATTVTVSKYVTIHS